MQKLIRSSRFDSSVGSLDRFAGTQSFRSMEVVGCRDKASQEGWGPKDLERDRLMTFKQKHLQTN
jgi:hypothetical protein